MSVQFTPVAKTSIRNPEQKQYYAGLVKGPEMTHEELIKYIGKLSGINEPYIEAVLYTMEKVLIEQLSQGGYVHFARLGTFFLTFKSKGSDTPQKVTHRNIEGLNVRFKPAKKILDALKDFTFKKVRRK